MFRLFRTIRDVEKATTNVNEQVLVKLNALLDDVGNILNKLENQGLDITLDVAGKKIPAKINIDLGQSQPIMPDPTSQTDANTNSPTTMEQWLNRTIDVQRALRINDG